MAPASRIALRNHTLQTESGSFDDSRLEPIIRPDPDQTVVRRILSSGGVHGLTEGDDKRRGMVVDAMPHDSEDAGGHLQLECANVRRSPLRPEHSSLISGHAWNHQTGIDRRAACQQCHCRGRPAVVLQRAETGVDWRAGGADQVAVHAVVNFEFHRRTLKTTNLLSLLPRARGG